MAFAGLRRDDERADVLAYLAANSPSAPAFPEPLPEDAGDEAAEGETEEASAEAGESGAVDAAVTTTEEEITTEPAEATGVIETVDMIDDTDQPEGNEGEVELAPAPADVEEE